MYYDDLFIESKLPEPLTETEIYYYFEKYKFGDTSARDTIINCNIKLVLNEVLKKFDNTLYEKSELISIGLIGLIKSVDTFDTSKKFKFSTYAIRCIDNEIIIFIRKGKKNVYACSFEDKLAINDNGIELTFKDILYDENSDIALDYEEKEMYSIIRKIVDELPERDKEIITLYFGFNDEKPLKQREIANKLNISRAYVSKLIIKAVEKIKRQLQRQEIIETTGIIESNLKNSDMKENDYKTGIKMQSIYDYFKQFTKLQVDEMMTKLTDEERHLIILRYGSALAHPAIMPEWDKEHEKKFYGSLVKKNEKTFVKTRTKRETKNSQT